MPLHHPRRVLPLLAALCNVHCHSLLWSLGDSSNGSSNETGTATTNSENSTSGGSSTSNPSATVTGATSSGGPSGDSNIIQTGSSTHIGSSTLSAATEDHSSSTGLQNSTSGIDSGGTIATESEGGVDSFCGNNVVDPDHMEECEPPNTENCDAHCRIRCGNSDLDNNEECDEGPNNGPLPNFCNNSCKRNGLFVFVSDEAYSGDLGGLFELGTKCDNLAQKSGSHVSGSHFLPWISVGVGPEIWPECSDTKKIRPYYLADKLTLVAKRSPPLEPLEHPIDMDQFGTQVEPDGVWTNTYPNGTSVSPDKYCEGWTSGSHEVLAFYGLTSKIDERWTRVAAPGYCDTMRRIYCFEQPSELELCATP